jgi:hypothetical protein
MKTVFMSDIHIGTDALTNLYHSDKNQATLKRILSYIQDNGSQIKDVVILGDWLDLWMFPSSVIPPTAQQIMDANPGVFTVQPDGDFISAMDSIQGNLVYVNGNHDITVTDKDINDHFAPLSKKGKHVHCLNSTKGPAYYSSGPVYGEHGHWGSMVCRPYNGELLSLGYYMTRAGMQQLANGRDLPPLNVLAVQELISYNDLTFAQAMLTFQANQLGFSRITDLVFTMPDGSTIGADAVANKFPGLSINDVDFLRVDVGGSLNVIAASHLAKSKHRILVLGHTHIKELYAFETLSGSDKVYANSGLLCATTPDQNGIPVSTFVEVEDNGNEAYTVSMISVNYATGAFSVDKSLTC